MKCSNKGKQEIGKRISLTENYVKEAVLFLKNILNDIKIELVEKYSKYNKENLIRNSWKYLFQSSLLDFDKVCEFEENGNFYFNTDYLEENFSYFSSSEQLLLSILIQQFSGSILDDLTTFRDLPMLAHMSDKEKLYFIIELFDNYPLLFQN